MDTTVLIFVILALVTIVGFFLFRSTVGVDMGGPLGFLFKFRGSNKGTSARRVKSGGNVTVHAEDGGGASGSDIDAKKDVTIRSSAPRPGDPPKV